MIKIIFKNRFEVEPALSGYTFLKKAVPLCIVNVSMLLIFLVSALLHAYNMIKVIEFV